jgi:hypothetical protein
MRSRISRALSCALIAGSISACSSGGGYGGGGGTPPGPSGTTITLTVSGAAPTAAAVQVGAGAWATKALSGNGASFTVPAGTTTYGVAVVCPPIFEFIELLSINDTKTPVITCPANGTTSTSVSYDVSQIPSAAQARVYIGSAASFQSTTTGTASFTDAPSGTQDVALLAFPSGLSATDALAVKILRAQSIPGALSISALNGTDNTSSASIGLSGAPAGFTTQVNAWYETAGGAQLLIKNAGSTTSYPTVANADTLNGDYYLVQAFASNNTVSGVNQVGASQTFSTPQSVSLTFPSPMTYAAPAAAQYPTFAVPAYSGFTVSGPTAFLFGAFAPMQNEITVATTSTYLSSVGNSLAFPNLSSLAGFFSEPTHGNAEDWLVEEATSTNLNGNYLFSFPYANNGTQQYALVSGQFTVP